MVDSKDIVEECRTTNNNKSREYLREEFKAFRMKMSVFTPSFSVSTESGHESIYNKIKLHLEDYPHAKRDTINKLFLPSSTIAKIFYTKLKTLNLTSKTDLSTIGGIRIQTLLNSLEKVVDVPSTSDNSITREDLIGEDLNLHSIYEKITNVIRAKNFNSNSRISKLKFEPPPPSPILRKEFYNYIKVFELTNVKYIGHTSIIFIQNRLKQEIDIP